MGEGLVVKMRKNKNKTDFVEKIFEDPNEELHFVLWQAELDRDLKAFWKAMTKKDDKL